MVTLPQDPQGPQDPEKLRREREERRFMATFRVAAQSNPILAGEARRIGEKIGVSPDLVLANPDVARETLRDLSVGYQEMRDKFPTTFAHFERLDFARVAHNDLDNLRATEGAFEWFGRNMTKGRMTNERGFIGLRQALGYATDLERQRADDIEVLMADERKGDSGFLGSTAQVLGQAVETLPIALGVGGAAAGAASIGGPITAGGAFAAGAGTATFTLAGAIAAGNAYRDMLARGIPERDAKLAAFGSGVLQGALETVGGSIALAPIRKTIAAGVANGAARTLAKETAGTAFGTFIRDYAKTWAGEVATEVGQEIAAATIEDQLTHSTGADDDETVGIRAWQAFEMSAKAMTFLSVPGPGLRMAANLARAREAQSQTVAFAETIKRANESQLRKNDPDAHADVVTAMAERATGDGNVYVAASKFAEVLRQADNAEVEAAAKMAGVKPEDMASLLPPEGKATARLSEILPDVASQLAGAIERGDDVSIPAGEFQAKLVGTPLGDALAPHLFYDRDNGMSAAEAGATLADQDAMAKDAQASAEADEKSAREIAAELREIEKTVAAQVVAAGRPKAEAAVGAKLWSAFVQTQSRREGISPAEFQKLTVGKGEGEGLHSANRGTFNPRDFAIRLTEAQNSSTFIHEVGHAFLSFYARTATAKVHPVYVDDFDTFLKWTGVESLEAWNALDFEGQRQHHEAFAIAFEEYVFEGKAPVPGLQRLFDRLMEFLKRVYKSIRGELNDAHRAEFGVDLPALTPEIRAVMDRMLASEEAVKVTHAVRGVVPMFQTAEEAGMTEEQWAEHQEKLRDADAAMVREMTAESLRAMRWLSGAKGKALKAVQAEAKKLRDGMRGEVAAEVQGLPVYRALRWLKTGEFVNQDGTKQQSDRDASHKLRTDAIPEDQREGLAGMLSADGMDPSVVAKTFGFESGDLLVAALRVAVPIDEAIEARIDRRMMAEHSNLSDPQKISDAIDRALHNDARRRFVAAELEALAGVGQPARVVLAATKAAAATALGRKFVRDIYPAAFTAAARRASEEARKAMSAGDTLGAIAAKRRQLVQEQMAVLAGDEVDQVRKTVQVFGKFSENDKDLGKRRDIDLVNAGRVLAAAYGLGDPIEGEQQRGMMATALQRIEAEFPAIRERLRPLLSDARNGVINYRNLTLAQFREVGAVAKWLWDESRAAKLVEIEGKRREIGQVVGQLSGQVATLPARMAPGAAPPEGRAPGPVGRLVLRGWSLLASLKRVESWASFMDGGKAGGPFQSLLVDPIQHAVQRYKDALAGIVERMHGPLVALAKAAGSSWHAEIAAPEIGYTFQGKKELVGALVHTGNASNLRKLLVGRGWGKVQTVDGQDFVDTREWDRFVSRMIDAGVLTKQDFDYVQTVWDTYAKILPEAQKTHKALYGYEFETVPLDPVENKLGKWRGGYAPARIDRDVANVLGRIESIETAGEDFRFSVGTNKGFTLARNPNYDKPLALDVTRQIGHMDEEVRFVHLQPAIAAALKVIRHRDFEAAVGGYDRAAIDNILLPWLENTALQRTSVATRMPILDAAFSYLRKATSLAALGFNFANALVQVTGLSSAVTQVRGSFMRSGLATWARNPGRARAEAEGKSRYMAQRFDQRTRLLMEELQRVADAPVKAGVKTAQQTLGRWAFVPQRTVQMAVDVVTWHGAHQQAIADGMTEDAAVAAADSAVRKAQGSAEAQDIAAYEATTPFQKLFVQFGSYSNVVLNQVLGSRSKAQAVAFAILLPAVMEATIKLALQGGPTDKDDDGDTIDDTTWLYGKAGLRNVAGLIPGVGPMFMTLAESEGQRVVASPASSLIQEAWRGMTEVGEFAVDDETTAAEVRAMATFLTFATGLPIAAPVRTAQSLVSQHR